MKRNLLSLLLLVCAAFAATTMQAQTFVNLTPKPKQMTVGTGELVLPAQFVVGTAGLDGEMAAEAARFVEAFNHATGYNASVSADAADALVRVSADASLAYEAYRLAVTEEGVSISASSATGLFFGFQTLKKILPANVMAGVADASVTRYALPVVDINDAPRFEYRGFMLDVSRHFFTIEEVKRMIDVMAYYKMNRFHWHLSDDQGWRVEIKKYPKLTSVGSIAPNSRFTDMYTCTQYWINKPYGPYFYTQEQIKDVVAYAKERHIEIVPEIDMPGHFVAAMASYPEYSCYPDGSHVIWSDGGISSDVLNVANPAAVQFAKDILDELIEIFPYETIHIGGDECPTSAWEGNAECQAYYKEQGLTNYRQLQSHFIKEMADFVQSKGRKLAVWNEAITAGSADVETVKSTDALVYCWTGADAAVQKAAQLGLKNIYTPWGPYYINRRQGNSPQDPPGAGSGTDDVRATYNQAIPSGTDYGVQGTFWCEHVSDREYMEWLALPRLIAIAEAGWTPQNRRSFSDFQERMTADTVLLNYGDYKYCKYHMLGQETTEPDMVMPKVNTAEDKYYYRLISGGTDATRKDRCIELIAAGSPLLTTYADKNAAVGRLWTNTQAAEGDANYDYQWWSLEEDPANPGKYAIVCKAMPEGSVKPNPTATSTAGRWDYDNTTKHYNFQLGTGAYGKVGDNYYYTIASDKVSGQYWNSSMAGQGLAVNVYSNPNDGAGGQWQWSPMEDYGTGAPAEPAVAPLTEGANYVFVNSVEGYGGTLLADEGKTTNLAHSTNPFASTVWTVEQSAYTEGAATQTLRLKNAVTGRYISGSANFVSREGFPVTVGANGAEVTLANGEKGGEYRLKVGGHSLFPLPSGQVNAGATVDANASYDAPRLQGAAWTALPVRLVTIVCVDEQGGELGTYQRGVDVGLTELNEALCPEFRNHMVQSVETTAENTYKVTYKRTACDVNLQCRDQRGAIIDVASHVVPLGESLTLSFPEVPGFYTFAESDVENGTVLTPTTDMNIVATYTTNAYNGVKKLGEPVSTVEAGHSYVIYDCSPDNGGGRKGYRAAVASNKQVNRVTAIEDASPLVTWLLEKFGSGYKVKNEALGLYVPLLSNSQCPTLGANGGTFTFSVNTNGTWKIKGSNGTCWDGQENGNLVGWNDPGHPYNIYTYYAQPYFGVTVNSVTTDNTTLATSSALVKGGEAYTLTAGTFEGYVLKEVRGGDALDAVSDHLTVTLVYEPLIPEGIQGVEAATGASSIYDLQGRRLPHISRSGLYIVNGRKVLVK